MISMSTCYMAMLVQRHLGLKKETQTSTFLKLLMGKDGNKDINQSNTGYVRWR